MKIDNAPHLYEDDPEIRVARQGIKCRGEYLYFLLEAAKRKGLTADFACEAIFDWGKHALWRKWDHQPEPCELAALFTDAANKVWENEINVTGDAISVTMRHCPLLAGWMECTDDVEKWKELCHICMEADRAMFDIPGYAYELTETLFDGCGRCTMVARKVKDGGC